MLIEISKHKALESLLAREFHKPDGKYDETEVKAFCQRLTNQQKRTLSIAKDETLISFIILGDGSFEKQMGGLFLRTNPLAEARPNASFSLFYKHTSTRIELVFYTRFFVINYGSNVNRDKKIQRLVKSIRGKSLPLDPKQRSEKLSEFLKILRDGWYPNKMRRTPSQKKHYLSNVSEEKPISCYLHVNSVNNYPHRGEITLQDYHKDYIRKGKTMLMGTPYITIVANDSRKPRIIPFMNVGKSINTLHGALDTLGCWMIFRNYMWNWPKENSHYDKLAALYRKEDRDPRPNEIKRFIKTSAATNLRNNNDIRKWYSNWSKNFIYYEVIRRFVGIHYNCYKKNIDRWIDDDTFSNFMPWNRYTVKSEMVHKRFKTSLPEDSNGFWKGEMIRFVSGGSTGKNCKIINYKKRGSTLVVNATFPIQSGEEFVVDNCFNWKKPIQKGINMFGKKFTGKPWCKVYFYERTDRITGPYDDKDKFR